MRNESIFAEVNYSLQMFAELSFNKLHGNVISISFNF